MVAIQLAGDGSMTDAHSIEHGRMIHDQFIRSTVQLDVVVGSALVDMYSKCSSLAEARNVFDNLPDRNVVAWGAMVAGYSQCTDGQLALQLFDKMQLEGIKPNEVIYSCILKACGKLRAIEQGRLVHDHINRSDVLSDDVVGSLVVDMYAKCQSLRDARRVFDKLGSRDVDSWGSMITVYAEHGHDLFALELFAEMQQKGIEPNKVTLFGIMKACSSIGAIEQGRQIHQQVVKWGLGSDLVLGNTLIDMYAKCGSLQEAWYLFCGLPSRDVVSWGIMVAGCLQHRHDHLALELFKEMQQEGIKPDTVAFLGALKACVNLRIINEGRVIHQQIIKTGFDCDVVVGSTLVGMYSGCKSLEEASKVFTDLPDRDDVVYCAMISAYAEHGHGFLALELFEGMQQEGLMADKITFFSLLKACGSIGAIRQGRLIHDQIIKIGYMSDVVAVSTLVDMYVKCGNIEEGHSMCNDLHTQDAVLCSVMIAGYAQHGNWNMAKQCFEDLEQRGLKPSDVLFTNILAICSHAGQLEEAHKFFMLMIEDYGITPCIEHYSCMVDLFGRSGCLNDAEDLLLTMPIVPNSTVWTSLLTSCKTYCSVELGRRCFEVVARSRPHDASVYVLMSSVYTEVHNLENVDEVQKLRKRDHAQKKPGRAWIEVKNKVHEFIVGGSNQLESGEIYVKVKRLCQLFKDDGQMPQLDLVMEPLLV